MKQRSLYLTVCGLLAALCLLVAVVRPAFAAAFTSSQTGPWNMASTWGGAGIPVAGDTVTIGSGHTVTVPDGYSAACGTSPASGGTTALTINGALVIGNGTSGQLTIKGPVVNGNAPLTLNAGSVLEFDTSGAASPASQTYAWTVDGFSRGNRLITCNGTSGAHVTIRSNAGGGDGYFFTSASQSDTLWLNATYTDFQRIGDATHDAFKFDPSSDTTINTIKSCTFDSGSGRVLFNSNPPAGGGWDLEDTYFSQTGAVAVGGFSTPLQITAGAAAATGSRKVYRNRFTKTPVLVGNGTDYQDNYFETGWQDSLSNTLAWTQMLGAFYRGNVATNSNYENVHGSLDHCFILFDPDQTAVASGTATAGGSTTLTDAAASWSSGAWNATGGNVWLVEILAGTGVGQRRYISGNTGTVLTVGYRWDVTPDSSSQYRVLVDIANCHGFSPNGNVTSTTPITYESCIAQFSGTDTQGDLYSHSGAHPITITHNVVLPNGMGDSSVTPSTFSTDTGAGVAEHNTWFMGAQALSISEAANEAAGTLTSVRSNIGWSDPLRTYLNHGGAGGPFLVSNSNIPTSTNVDIVSANGADYNCTYGLRTDGRAATDFPGSPAAQVGPYHYRASVAPGAHDVQGNPQFVAPTRSFWSWAVSRGSSAQSIGGQISDGLTYIKADPTLTRSSLIPYIQAGFAPRNSALRNAGHDSVTIGAVEGLFGRNALRAGSAGVVQ